jgi:hypothetical protein
MAATYRRYATTLRFHIDLCLPRSPEHKGKVERHVRTQRGLIDPSGQHWSSLAELQARSNQALAEAAVRRRCPATGSSVREAWSEERRHTARYVPCFFVSEVLLCPSLISQLLEVRKSGCLISLRIQRPGETHRPRNIQTTPGTEYVRTRSVEQPRLFGGCLKRTHCSAR